MAACTSLEMSALAASNNQNVNKCISLTFSWIQVDKKFDLQVAFSGCQDFLTSDLLLDHNANVPASKPHWGKH